MDLAPHEAIARYAQDDGDPALDSPAVRDAVKRQGEAAAAISDNPDALPPELKGTAVHGSKGEAKPRWPDPVPISQLPDRGPQVDWILHGCIASGHLTLFSALMKAGKSTFVGHLLRCLQAGTPFIGRDTKEARTLVVSEESAAIWRRRRDTLGLDDHLHLLCRPMLVKPNFAEWTEFVAYLAVLAVGTYDLVVLDTLSAFAPWRSENDSAEVMGTLTPLNQLTERGVAVLANHHHGKADATEGRAARGSTAIAGAVDILLEMRRFKTDDLEDRRRVLCGLGRFDEIPAEVVVSLNEDGTGYTAMGDRKAEAAREVHAAILDALPSVEPGATTTEVHEAMTPTARPQRSKLGQLLNDGAAAGHWFRTGSGTPPKDPWRFYRRFE